MNAVIQVEHVTKRLGELEVLQDVCREFSAGRIHGIVGNNGAGKTVLMKCICGFMRPDQGRVLVRLREVGREMDFPEDLGIIIERSGGGKNLSGRSFINQAGAANKGENSSARRRSVFQADNSEKCGASFPAERKKDGGKPGGCGPAD